VSPLRYEDLEASRERFCPFCDEPLTHHRGADEVEVDRCTQCGATWFDRNDLRRSGLHMGLPTHSEMLLLGDIWWKGQKVHCPRCDVRALRVGSVGNLGVAYCERCRGYLVQGDENLEVEPRILQRIDVRERRPHKRSESPTRRDLLRLWMLPAAMGIAVVAAVLTMVLFFAL
jgi:Zn-finger nucleic acid-binding protein